MLRLLRFLLSKQAALYIVGGLLLAVVGYKVYMLGYSRGSLEQISICAERTAELRDTIERITHQYQQQYSQSLETALERVRRLNAVVDELNARYAEKEHELNKVRRQLLMATESDDTAKCVVPPDVVRNLKLYIDRSNKAATRYYDSATGSVSTGGAVSGSGSTDSGDAEGAGAGVR